MKDTIPAPPGSHPDWFILRRNEGMSSGPAPGPDAARPPSDTTIHSEPRDGMPGL